MSEVTGKDHDDNAHEEEVADTDVAAWEAARWEAAGVFDWYTTFSFDQRTHERYRLDKPDSVVRFVRQRLELWGYFGPYVIVPHDNWNTRYFHAHVLLADYKSGLCERIAVEARRFGNVQKVDDGPIRGSGAYLYCANRAIDYHTKEAAYDERLTWRRHPRPRGRGAKSSRGMRTEAA